MNKNYPAMTFNTQDDKKKRLKDQVQAIIASKSLDNQRVLINAIAAELQITVLDCAAALVALHEASPDIISLSNTSQVHAQKQKMDEKSSPNNLLPGIRLVRYRLDVGFQHKVTLDEIKKILVEESGVDIKNIANVRIQDCYTLIDLPDEMPQEIFHHLKTVEINQQQLDIRRVKPRNKKRGNYRNRRTHLQPVKKMSKD
jgi:DbpA RNA binding domain